LVVDILLDFNFGARMLVTLYFGKDLHQF
jgi:hypothetical protein